jgi:hypothetical protein
MQGKGKGKKEKWRYAVLKELIPFAFYLFTFTLPLYADSLAENQARFGKVTGTVQIVPQGSSRWIDAHIDLPFELGDEIRVGEDSEAELSVARNALWIVQANSDLIVGQTTTQEGHLTLKQGTLIGKVGPAANGAEGSWEFETPMAVCAVRGTEFALLHSEEDGTHLGVFKGSVGMTPAETATQSFQTVMINAHEEGVLEKKKTFKKMTAWTPLLQAQAKRLQKLQKRFQAIADVWSPFTEAYREELRRKYIPRAEHHNVPVRHAPPKSKVRL